MVQSGFTTYRLNPLPPAVQSVFTSYRFPPLEVDKSITRAFGRRCAPKIERKRYLGAVKAGESATNLSVHQSSLLHQQLPKKYMCESSLYKRQRQVINHVLTGALCMMFASLLTRFKHLSIGDCHKCTVIENRE